MVAAPPKVEAAEIAALPIGLASVVDVSGDISIARVRGTSEAGLADYLSANGIDWYNPREQYRVTYADAKTGKRHTKTRTRAFLAGFLFVGGGYDGRSAATTYGSLFRNQFFGFIGFNTPSASRRLLLELVSIERMLAADPTLSARSGLRRGQRVRVVAGHRLEGLEGVIERDGRAGALQVNCPILGISTPFEIDPADLETVG